LNSDLPNEHVWRELQNRFHVWKTHDDKGGSQVLVDFLAACQPWIETALSLVEQRHNFIASLGTHTPEFQRAVLDLQKLPSSPQFFAIWLQSHALRLLKIEAQEKVVPIQVPGAPWHGFRRRFNALPTTERSQVLNCLPACDAVPFLSKKPQLPNGSWLVLWKEITDGVPQDSLPRTWRRYLKEEAPTALAEVKDSTLILPGCSALPQRRIVLPSRKFEKQLGRIFHQAAAWSESKFESHSPLILPDWVIPKSSTLFLHTMQDVIARNGGMPTDASLREQIEELMDTMRAHGEKGIAQHSPLDLRKVADDLGTILPEGASLMSLHHRRRNESASGKLSLERALSYSTEKKDVAATLANLASFKADDGDFDEAELLLQEALRLNPWSRLARNNYSELKRFLQDKTFRNSGRIG